MIEILKTCPVCGEASMVEVALEGWLRWQAGELAQDAFPELPADRRETLISGTHPECWTALFGGEDDGDR